MAQTQFDDEEKKLAEQDEASAQAEADDAFVEGGDAAVAKAYAENPMVEKTGASAGINSAPSAANAPAPSNAPSVASATSPSPAPRVATPTPEAASAMPEKGHWTERGVWIAGLDGKGPNDEPVGPGAPKGESLVSTFGNGRTQNALYFGNDAGRADAARMATEQVVRNDIRANDPNAGLFDSLQRTAMTRKKQDAAANDALVTDAAASVYKAWQVESSNAKSGSVVRTPAEKAVVDQLNASLEGHNANFRIRGIVAVGQKDGRPIFNIYGVNNNGNYVVTRTLDDLYKIGAKARGAVDGEDKRTLALDGKGEITQGEQWAIDKFGDRMGTQNKYNTVHADEIQKRAIVKNAQDAADKDRQLKFMEIVGRMNDPAQGGKHNMSFNEFATKILTDKNAIKLLTQGKPVYETDDKGNVVMENGKPKQRTAPDENGNMAPVFEPLNSQQATERLKEWYSQGQRGVGSSRGTDAIVAGVASNLGINLGGSQTPVPAQTPSVTNAQPNAPQQDNLAAAKAELARRMAEKSKSNGSVQTPSAAPANVNAPAATQTQSGNPAQSASAPATGMRPTAKNAQKIDDGTTEQPNGNFISPFSADNIKYNPAEHSEQAAGNRVSANESELSTKFENEGGTVIRDKNGDIEQYRINNFAYLSDEDKSKLMGRSYTSEISPEFIELNKLANEEKEAFEELKKSARYEIVKEAEKKYPSNRRMFSDYIDRKMTEWSNKHDPALPLGPRNYEGIVAKSRKEDAAIAKQRTLTDDDLANLGVDQLEKIVQRTNAEIKARKLAEEKDAEKAATRSRAKRVDEFFDKQQELKDDEESLRAQARNYAENQAALHGYDVNDLTDKEHVSAMQTLGKMPNGREMTDDEKKAVMKEKIARGKQVVDSHRLEREYANDRLKQASRNIK